MYEITYYSKIQKRRFLGKKKYFKFFLNLALIVFVFYFLFSKFIAKTPDEEILFISPLANVIQKTVFVFNSRENSKQLESIVLENLKEDKDKFGIVVKNLKTGERYYLNEHKIYETASLYKLWVMATAYQQIRDGKISQTDILKSDVSKLNEKFNIASESAELIDGTVSWPVQNALWQMIVISDNYSALLLAERVRLANVTAFLSENGFLESKVGGKDTSPISSAADISLFFEKLYNGELLDKTYSNKMLELLKAQRLNNKIPKYLPKDVVIAHKTAELGGLTHDGGVVYKDKGDYIIIVLSDGKSPSLAEEKIAEVSKAVYEYFLK